MFPGKYHQSRELFIAMLVDWSVVRTTWWPSTFSRMGYSNAVAGCFSLA